MGDTHKIQFYRVALRRGLGIRKLHCREDMFRELVTYSGATCICHNAVFDIFAEKQQDGYNLYIMKRYHYFRKKKNG